MKFSSRLLPANPWDFSLPGFSVGFVLYYFDVALLMSCEISSAEHSVPWAHSCVWQFGRGLGQSCALPSGWFPFQRPCRDREIVNLYLAFSKGLTKELKSSISIGEGWQSAAVLTHVGVWEKFGTKESRGWGQVKCSRFCRQRQFP